MSLVVGVSSLNVLLLAAGYCALAGPLWGRGVGCWISYAGVAFMVGAGLVVTGVFFAYIAGAPNGALALAAAVVVVVSAGIGVAAASPRWRAWSAVPSSPPRECTRAAAIAETAAFTALVAVAVILLVGGFRSSPWLDDIWGIWVPKGRTLDRIGLDQRLFAPNGTYLSFGVLHYPLWWSSLTGLDLRFVRSVDLRAVAAQDTLLLLGFLGASARLLWTHVRPWLIGGSLLLVAALPELARHARGGLADLPVGAYLALCGLAAFSAIASTGGFRLLLVAAFGATALQIKSEGMPQLALLGAFSLVVAWRMRPRLLSGLTAAWAVVAASAVPWQAWLRVHHVHPEETVPFLRAVDPSYLMERAGRFGPAADTLGHHLVNRHEWLLLVPLSLVLAAELAVIERQLRWLSPVVVLGSLYMFWIWVYWTHPDRLEYIIDTSSYRVIDGAILLTGLSIPLLAEGLLRSDEMRARRRGRGAKIDDERRVSPGNAAHRRRAPFRRSGR